MSDKMMETVEEWWFSLSKEEQDRFIKEAAENNAAMWRGEIAKTLYGIPLVFTEKIDD